MINSTSSQQSSAPQLPSWQEIQAEIRRRQALRVQTDAEAIRARCRTLEGFVREAWPILEPTTPYVHNWHISAICAHLEAITFGRIKPRLLVNVPPGSMKSLLVSVLWNAWEWGPCGLRSLRYLTTSFNDGPVKRDTRKCRDLILSPWYQTLWPEVQLTRTGETSFANSDTGTREGVSFPSLTSQRGDRLLIDDPHSVETAESDAEREATTRRFREGALNRLNDQQRSAIVVIMQRLHEDDISGVILSREMDFVHLRLPMRFEADHRCVTPIFSDPRTADGELLDPARFPAGVVGQLERDMGEYAFAGQYMQRPSPRAGGMIKPDKMEIIAERPQARWVRGWDLASTKGAGDWTVGALIGETADLRPVIGDIIRIQGSPDEVEAAIVAAAARDGREVGISIPQDPGPGGKAWALHILRKLHGYVVEATPEPANKIVRAQPIASQINGGNVLMVAGPWNDPLVQEMRTFPLGRHDDQIDALSRGYSALVSETVGTPLFSIDSLLLNGIAPELPSHCDAVFATIASNTKTGKPGDSVAVIFWIVDKHAAAFPLMVADWELRKVDEAMVGSWLPSVYQRLVEMSQTHRARHGALGVFIDDSGTGAVLLQQAMGFGAPIESRLTTMGKSERAVSISGYVLGGEVKLARPAHEKVTTHRGITRNQLIGEILAFRVGAKDDATAADTLLEAFSYGVALGVGTPNGF